MALEEIAGYNLLTTIFSAIRERVDVTKIGRKSPTDARVVTLGTGVTTAIFQLPCT